VDDEWRIDADEPGPHVLVFDEDVAVDREDLVAEAVEFLPTVPGVTAVEHVDREVVLIAAPGVPASRLTAALRHWWDTASLQPRPWMSAMARAAEVAARLTPGYRRDGWGLVRAVDHELDHVISLTHRHGGPVTVTARVRLRLPDDEEDYTVAHDTFGLGDDAALDQVVTGRIRPALDALPSVDAMLERWRQGRSIVAGGRAYTTHEARLHARVLVARGRVAEAWPVYQWIFDWIPPRQRPSLLRLAAGLGVPPLATGANPNLSRAEEATLGAWQASTAARVEVLRGLTGARLPGTRRSLVDLWERLRDCSPALRGTSLAPALPASFYGTPARGYIEAGRVPFEPWHRVTVELVCAYLGLVVMNRAPGATWTVAADGELALARLGGAGVLSRVFALTRSAFVSESDFDRRRLRRLADDLIRWVERPGPV
jgi:hypothetical protein